MIKIDIFTARKLMGPHAIIGVTCSSSEEACTAATDGADYLGIGTMFATPTWVWRVLDDACMGD